jgi:hypothetical protein
VSDPIIDAVQAVIDGGGGRRLESPDGVNPTMIRHWVSAFFESNPVYGDPSAAAASRHGQQIAPPAMLGVWTMDTPRHDGGPRDVALRALDEAGFDAVVATDYSHEYLQPMTIGMQVSEERSIEWVQGPKETGLGTGYFVGTRYDYRNGEGELIGIARMKLLKFRPKVAST